MIVQKVLPSLYNGMSEQPPDIRLDNQCDLQVNGVSDLVFGLSKREPTQYIAKIMDSSTNSDGLFCETFTASNGKDYLLIITKEYDNPIKVFDLTTNSFKFVFISSESIKQYLTTGSKLPYQKIKTLNTREGVVVLNTEVITKKTSDLSSGTLKGTVQQFSKLPTSPTVGDVYQIAGDESNKYTSYFVRYTGEFWLECVKPQIQYKLDNTTLPFVIVYSQVSDSFVCSLLTYKDRTIGDDDSNPFPSFVDKKINNLFLFRGRMGFLTDDSVILSKADEYTNFFYGTALDILDDDPVDLTVETKSKIQLYHAIPFNKNLTLFSQNSQFTLTSGDGLLTPKSASIVPSTYFSTDFLEPIGVDDKVYFTSSVEGKTRLMEYFVSGDTYNETAIDVSSAVPNLLPKLDKIENSNTNNIIFCFSKNTPNKIYIYKYFWDGQNKVQSSWSIFEFGYDIINITIFDNYLIIIASKDGEMFIEKMFLKIDDNKPKLDRQVLLSNGVYSDGYTTFTLPYKDSDNRFLMLDTEGFELDTTKTETSTLKVFGDYTGKTLVAGKKYDFRYVFSKPVIKTESKIGVPDIKMKIKKITLSFVNTGYFKLLIKPVYRNIIEYIYNSVFVNIYNLNIKNKITTTEDFIVMCDSKDTDIELFSDSYLPCRFMTASFTLNYFIKGRVI